jgi:hypothetical protein
MPSSPPRQLSPKHVAIDAVLCLVAFVIFYEVVKIHVPSNDRLQVGLWASFTATCMTGVFWIAWQMLKSVYRHQRAGGGDKS